MTGQSRFDLREDVIADRLALRELADRYAQAVDRRRVDLFAELFCPGARMCLPHPAAPDRPNLVFDGSDGWSRLWSVLDGCVSSTHFTANQLVTIAGDEATGETYCLAHELRGDGENLRMLVRGIRYADVWHREDGRWLFLSRTLSIDWTAQRLLSEPSSRVEGNLP